MMRRVPPRLIEEVRASVVHRDEILLAVNKPAGLAVHGGSGVSFGVIEALATYPRGRTRTGAPSRPRHEWLPPHRAQGVGAAHPACAAARACVQSKRYLALVAAGKWDLGKKRIDMPLRTDLRVGGKAGP